MHVLEIVSAKESNGVTTHLRLLLPALAARGHRVTVLTREGSPFAETFGAMGLETLSSDLHRWPGDELDRIGSWAREQNVDVIHAHMSRANNFGARLQQATGIPCVMTAHSLRIHPHWLVARRVLAVSAAAARLHRRWSLVPAGRMETILNFIDPATLVASPDARARLRSEWGVGEDELLLGTVGLITRNKGQDVLVAAMGKTRTPFRLVVVGRGDPAFVDPLKEAAGDRALWLGFRTDVHEVLSALDGIVMATRSEGLPLALLEAMAMGLPIVASRVGGIPELVTGGECGYLTRPGDADDLARALDALGSLSPEERRALGARGRDFVLAHATLESQVPKIEAALLKVCRKSGL